MKEFKVDLKPLIKKLEVHTKKGIYGWMTGIYRSAFRGRGLEFDRFRKYDPTQDDASMIDWKTSSRSRYPVVREYVEERNISVIFLIDVSSSMSFTSIDKLKNEYVIELFASLSFAMIQAGDAVGLALFSNDLVGLVKPNIGIEQFYILIKTITNPNYYEGSFNFENSLKSLNSWSRRGAIVIIISDFIGLTKNWLDVVESLGNKFEIIAIMVRDPRDYVIPEDAGQVVVGCPDTGDEMLIDCKKMAKKYEKFNREEVNAIKKGFEKAEIDFLELRTDQDFVEPIIEFFEGRK